MSETKTTPLGVVLVFQRWGQPAQQHGRLIPPLSFDSPTLIRRLRVSDCFAEVIQQIHSLRASGVMSSHVARAFGAEASAFRRSAGTLCTPPSAFPFLVIFYNHDP